MIYKSLQINTPYTLQSNNQLTLHLKVKGICTWNHLTEYMRHLTHCRNTNCTCISFGITKQKRS